MKRHNESSEDEREPKRAKIEQQNDEDPLFPPEILQKIVEYACHEDIISISCLLVSAKLFEAVLSEENWKLLYVLRWHQKILGEDGDNYSNEEIISEIEQHLSIEPNDYVDKQFYENSAWKNRYKYRAQLELEGRRVSDQDLTTKGLYETRKCSFTFYRLYSGIDGDFDHIQYSNLAKIEAVNKREILAIQARRKYKDFDYDDEDKAEIDDEYHAILIANTGAPVMVRLETLDGRNCGGVEKKYFNTRILAFNWKNQIWDVISAQYCNSAIDKHIISAQYCNYAVEEDEINHYKPYCMEFSNALFAKEKTLSTPGRRTTSYEKHYNGDLYRIICAAAKVTEQHTDSNTSGYVDLDAVIREEEEDLTEHG